MKKLILTILILHFSLLIADAQWTLQYSAGNVYINSIQFVDINTGYAVGWTTLSPEGYVYKTTNSGVNWTSLTLPSFMPFFLYNLSFINSNTGYVCGFGYYIYKTTDGGLNWDTTVAPHIMTQTYRTIQFFDENTGYLGGRYGNIVKTTNGGTNWITLDTLEGQILGMNFLDINYGFLGDSYSGIYKTTNGGLNFTRKSVLDTNGSLYDFEKIKFINYNTGYAIGARLYCGAVFKTTNGGDNWKNILITDGNPLHALEVKDDSIVYALGEADSVLKSTNGGKNWVYQHFPVPQSGNTQSLFFINANTGVCSFVGNIFRTTNGGSVFVSNISSEVPAKYALYQNYPNPFNPSTIVKFSIPLCHSCGSRNPVRLIVYDILGKEVATLVNEKLQAGTYEVNFDGNNLSTGIYFYSLEVDGKRIDTKKLLMIK